MFLSARSFVVLAMSLALTSGWVVLDAQLPPPPPIPPPPDAAAVVRDYRPVTAERLKNPDADNWLMVRRTYDGWAHSPLSEIHTGNVAQLRLVWTVRTGEVR